MPLTQKTKRVDPAVASNAATGSLGGARPITNNRCVGTDKQDTDGQLAPTGRGYRWQLALTDRLLTGSRHGQAEGTDGQKAPTGSSSSCWCYFQHQGRPLRRLDIAVERPKCGDQTLPNFQHCHATPSCPPSPSSTFPLFHAVLSSAG